MTKLIQVRVDATVKTDVEEIFSSIGLDTATAVRMFFAAVKWHRGLPFTPTVPKGELSEAAFGRLLDSLPLFADGEETLARAVARVQAGVEGLSLEDCRAGLEAAKARGLAAHV
ncbi:MAG: type II toxin-antitoxin system RelB/DinJ family antitoxin [Oscillospiraceae bacterium]|nr:type II toxin-antitoxin system RelB/DinJ family antitoxin [Oscillospiraceae bacterium]